MPMQRCSKGGKPGFRWGNEGVCYTYDPKSEASRNTAKRKAFNQGIAIEGSPDAAAKKEQNK